MRLWLIGCLLVGVILLTSSVLAADEHEAQACPIQSWSQKTGPNEFWLKILTACNDHPAAELTHTGWLQYYDWDDLRWRSLLMAIGGGRNDTDFFAQSRFRPVLEFGGMACYRVKTNHFVIEWYKDTYAEGTSYSTQQCY